MVVAVTEASPAPDSFDPGVDAWLIGLGLVRDRCIRRAGGLG